MSLTDLQKKGRENFVAEWPGLVQAFESAEETAYFLAFQDALITRVYTQAIEDAEGALPGMVAPHDSLPIELSGEASNDGYNYYRTQALTALEALIPNVEKV